MLKFSKENKKLAKFELRPKTIRYLLRQFLVFNIPVGSFAAVVVAEVDAELEMGFHCCKCCCLLQYYY